MSELNYEKVIGEGGKVKEEMKKGFIEARLSPPSPPLIGNKIKFDCLFAVDVVRKAIEKEIIIQCERCNDILSQIDLKNEENFELTYRILIKKLRIEYIPQTQLGNCVSANKHKPKLESSAENIDYSILFVKEILENIETKTEE